MTRKKLYVVELTVEEQKLLKKIISSGKHPARKILRSNILLKADINGLGWGDKQIEEVFSTTCTTVETCRKQFVTEGLERALNRKKQRTSKFRKKLDGEQEAKLVALVMSDPPEGRDRWSLRLLTSRLVELEIVEEISRETVRRTLKKMNLNLGTRNRG